MKKILGISLVAMMAVTSARAEIASKAYVDNTFATDAFVSGDDTLDAGFDASTVVGAINELKAGADSGASALQAADITTGATNGTIAVDGTDVSVYGLGTAAFKDTTNSYSSTGTDPVTGTAVAAALSAATNATTGTLVQHTANTAAGSATNPVYIAADGTATASNATVGSATQTVYLNAGTITAGTQLGTAASQNVATGTGAAGITDNGEGLVTADQVYEYVAANASASNFVAQTITDGQTTTAPSQDAVHDALALKQDKAIGTVGTDDNKIIIVGTDGNITKSGTVLGAAAGASLATNGVAANESGLVSGGQVATALANYTATTSLDSSTTATSGQVVTAISMADGRLSQTTADPLSVTNYEKVAGNTADGEYTLTMKVVNNTPTYKWELITRTGSEQLPAGN